MEAMYSSTAVKRWQTSKFKAGRWEDMTESVVTDELVTRLNEMIQAGFPEKLSDIPEDLKPFWIFRDDLYIPASLRGEVQVLLAWHGCGTEPEMPTV